MTRELLFSVTDFETQTFRAGGKGGQHQNKTDSGVRLIHRLSGARGESREERHQLQNKRKALRKLAADPRFQYWVHQQVLAIDGKSHVDLVGITDAQIKVLLEDNDPDHFKIEVKEDGRWLELVD